jgi:hypothetical protein
MNWIKAKDELPSTSGEYLHCNLGDDKASVAYYSAKEKTFNWHAFTIDATEVDNLWMPLPKPPEGLI